jgi:hypothetical protein
MALAKRLGLEGRQRILSHMLQGTPLLVSVKIEADDIAEAWAHYDDKVQLHAIQIAFDVLHHSNPNEPSEILPGILPNPFTCAEAMPVPSPRHPTKNPTRLSIEPGLV